MKLIARIFMLFMMTCLLSCSGGGGGAGGGGGGDDVNAQCSQNGMNEYVYTLLQDRYLWYDQVDPNLDYGRFSSPEALLESIKPAIDRWSYIESADNYYSYSEEGRYRGMGCSVAFDTSRKLWVKFVYDRSPARLAEIERSDEILSINGRAASTLSDLDAVWDEVYHYETAEFQVRKQNGDIAFMTLDSGWVTINSVLHHEVINVDAIKVGYLVFKTFIEPAEAELDAAFAYFNQEGIDELVLDLRYNGGGRGSIAVHLASLIAGVDTDGEVFNHRRHNDKYSQYDVEDAFTRPAHALSMGRVFVITTDNSCSASEVVINGLEPYIRVIQIGATTCGKPVGMYIHDFCDMVLLPIEFRSANANGETDYFNGLTPTCPAGDDVSRPFGDPEEASLETALYYIANESCPVLSDTVRAMQADKPLHINELRGFRREIGAF